jgi:hypothetical protein
MKHASLRIPGMIIAILALLRRRSGQVADCLTEYQLTMGNLDPVAYRLAPLYGFRL